MRNILAAVLMAWGAGAVAEKGAEMQGPPAPPPPVPGPVAETGAVTGRALPRLVTIKTGAVNVRRGPGTQYAVDWRFVRRGMPVEVVAEWGHWRRVRDMEGQGGWVHYVALSGRRGAIALTETVLRARPDMAAPVKARAEPGALVRAERCLPAGWCRMRAGSVTGWARADAWWGVRAGEDFD